jgi:hypothetical protein
VRNTFTTTPKPISGTPEQWRDWKKFAKKDNKFIYWFTEDFLNDVQDFFMFPVDVWDSVRIYIQNRFVTKTHMVNAYLPKGQWHETEERMLHGVFGLLTDFIEVEKASMGLWNEKNRTEFRDQIPWWRKTRFFNVGAWRSREMGIKCLEREMSLKHDEEWMDKEHPDYGKLTDQAKAACEQMELYLWWNDVRPYRPEPGNLSGYYSTFNKRLESKDVEDDIWEFLSKPITPEDDKKRDIMNDIERAQNEEDEEMLFRLIKLRKYLWT